MLKLHPSVISRRDGKCNVMFTLRNGIQYKKGVRERERERNRLGWGGGCLMDKHDAREFFFIFLNAEFFGLLKPVLKLEEIRLQC